MAIPTSRTKQAGIIHIDHEACNQCGLCAQICKDHSLAIENGHVVQSQHAVFGCFGCGHCMAICPQSAITIEGREISADDLLELPASHKKSSYDNLYNLMIGRRSIRDFSPKEIDQSIIDQIMDAALTAPVGLPPSDVNVLVFNGRENVREFAFDAIDQMAKALWLFKPPGLWLWKLAGMEAFEMMNNFGFPLINKLIQKKKANKDYLLYDAPLAMYFLASPYSDPVDPIIPATYAMLAAESLGLGSCMIGSIHPLIRHGAKKFKQRWAIPQKSTNGLVVIFGYPKFRFQKAMKRSFARVTTYDNSN